MIPTTSPSATHVPPPTSNSSATHRRTSSSECTGSGIERMDAIRDLSHTLAIASASECVAGLAVSERPLIY